MLTLINQEVTYIAYLNIHISPLRMANLNKKYNNKFTLGTRYKLSFKSVKLNEISVLQYT